MSEQVTIFDRLRAVVESGHLKDMTGLEAKALIAFALRANFNTGEAWPSIQTIADETTKNVHRARLAVKGLEARGILEEVSTGGGKGLSTKRRLAVKPHPLNRDANRPPLQTRKQGRFSTSNRDAFRPQTGTQTVPRTTKNDQLNDQRDFGESNRDGNSTPSGEQKLGAKKSRPKNDKPIEFPSELDTPVFRTAWGTWEQHRREIKKRLTPTSISQQLKKCAAMGIARAAAAIEHSIDNGYTGLFEPKSNFAGSNGHPRTGPVQNWNEGKINHDQKLRRPPIAQAALA